jgi:hypothetical protein
VALNEGYQLAALQASKMGQNVYRQLGFQDVDTLRIFTQNKP